MKQDVFSFLGEQAGQQGGPGHRQLLAFTARPLNPSGTREYGIPGGLLMCRTRQTAAKVLPAPVDK